MRTINLINLSTLILFFTVNSILNSQVVIPRQNDSTSCTWHADNGNGTFTNPIFYEEFSDPDLIRVGSDYYMTGTTMHAMPGLPVLHSKDLINWELLSYACEQLDLGPEFRMENGKEIYGQGFWAPCLRYNNGVFYIFSNVNRYNTQVFKAVNPAGPWEHFQMNVSLHDLSVLFDDDGKVYVVWGYDEIKLAELNEDLTDLVPGTEKVIIPAGSGAGEGSHFYKINGKYYITITNWDPTCYHVCARADNPYGPYEINVISSEENMGVGTTWRLWDTQNGPPFNLVKYDENYIGCIPMHQGGIVETDKGEWWGFSMMDYNSLGRVTVLSPVTWKDGWPYMGLPGNLKRSPRVWIKPKTVSSSVPTSPFERDDDFSGPQLKNVWQWNHLPNNSKWSLNERKGFLRLHSLPAESFWHARNSLTQRAIGPESYAITKMEFTNLEIGDNAGLALLNLPYAWIGVVKTKEGNLLQYYNQQKNEKWSLPLDSNTVWLRAYCNFDDDFAYLSYSLNGRDYITIEDKIILPYQLKTFQGVRYALFNFNIEGKEGGYADFDSFEIIEPRCKGLTKPIPYNKIIKLISIADSTVLVNWKNFLRPVPFDSKLSQGNKALFRLLDRGNGRIALQSVESGGFVTVKNYGDMAEVRIEKEEQGLASVFQWVDMLKGDIMLMSLYTHKYLYAAPYAGSLCSANSKGARPDRKGGECFTWIEVK